MAQPADVRVILVVEVIIIIITTLIIIIIIIIITLWLCTPGPRVVPSQAGQPCEHPLENQKQAWPLCPAACRGRS